MRNKSEVFELFHQLKKLTTAGYSGKKLQDLLEKHLEEVEELEFSEYVEQLKVILCDMKNAVELLEDITKRNS